VVILDHDITLDGHLSRVLRRRFRGDQPLLLQQRVDAAAGHQRQKLLRKPAISGNTAAGVAVCGTVQGVDRDFGGLALLESSADAGGIRVPGKPKLTALRKNSPLIDSAISAPRPEIAQARRARRPTRPGAEIAGRR